MINVSEVVPEDTKSEPLFSSKEEYLEFRDDFSEALRPVQEKSREARRRSEEEARHRLLR